MQYKNSKIISIELKTTQETQTWDVGKKVLSPFLTLHRRLHPEMIHQYCTKVGPFENLGSCEELWMKKGKMWEEGGPVSEAPIDFEWRRNRVVKYYCIMNHTDKTYCGNVIKGWFTSSFMPHKDIPWWDLFYQLCDALNPIYGMMHYISDEEFAWARSIDDENVGSFILGFIDAHREKPGQEATHLTNLGAVSFLGGQFKKEVDVGRIQDAGFPVTSVGGGYMVGVTDNPMTVAADYEGFCQDRQSLRSCFRKDLFKIP